VFRSICAFAACLACALFSGVAANGATVFETTELVGADAAADTALPAAQELEVATAGSYTLSLADLETPVLLQTLRAVVTRDLEVVAQVEVTYPTPPALPGAATQTFMATPGKYRVHVLGIPRQGEAGGGFSLKVMPAAGGTPLLDHADSVAAQSSPATGQSALQTTFNIGQAGAYNLTLTDHAFPLALASLQAILLRETDSGPVVARTGPGPFTVTTPGDYQLIVLATASSPDLAGLYGVRVAAGATIAYQSTQPVGNMAVGTAVTVANAGQYALTLADAAFPAALNSVAARVTQGDTLIGSLNAAGTTNVTAAAGDLRVFALAIPAAEEGIGAYQAQLSNAQETLLADIRTVDVSPDPASAAIYSFTPSTAVAAGAYQLKLEDLAFPAQFTSLVGALVQGTTVVGTVNKTSAAQFNLQSGAVKVLVAAKPPAASGNALFGITLSASTGTKVIESTQGVGGLFRANTVTIAATGSYDLVLKDLEFPARLATAQVALTRGTTLVAQIFGGGTAPREQLSTGTYVLNFLGQPAAAAQYGTYGLRVAESAPQPTVTLTATSSAITSGQSAALQWTSTNATGCTASNGWSGAKSAAGTETLGPLTANTTFALSCTGAGGTGTASLTVTVSAPASPSGGGGGGGAFNLYLLATLSVLLLVAQFRGGKGRARSH